jgi:hypothetical protein
LLQGGERSTCRYEGALVHVASLQPGRTDIKE